MAELTHQPRGAATLSHDAAASRISVRLEVTGLAPDSRYEVHLHRGSCLHRSDAVAVNFGVVTSSAAGAIDAAAGAAGAIPTGVYLDLHDSGSATPLVCTDVPPAAPTSPLGLFATPGFKPFASVEVDYRPGAAAGKLRMTAGDLVPGAGYAIDIEEGACAAPGRVAGEVSGVTADPQGKATFSGGIDLTASPAAGGWSVTVRSAGAARTPVLCGELRPG